MFQRAITLACLAFLSTVSINAQTPTKPISIEVLVDSIENSLLHNYVFLEKARLMVDKIKSQYKNGAYKSLSDPFQIRHAIENDIKSVHQDGHLHLNYDPIFAERLSMPGRGARSAHEDSVALRRMKYDNFLFNKVEILNGNIGYVLFRGFSGFVEEAKPTISAAFAFVKNTDAVIIDLRKNGGGSPWMVKQIASYFFKERAHLNDIYKRKQDETKEFWADPKDADGVSLLMPVYILTSKNTFSAAEDFTYAMQVNKRALIVGDTTGGGAHPVDSYPMGQGYVMDIPIARSINPITKTDWEGTGVFPNVPVRADEALAKAQELILRGKLATLLNDRDKEQVKLYIEALKPTVTLTAKQWQALDGRYQAEGNNKFHLQITSKGDKLILKQDWDGAEVVFEAKSDVDFFCSELSFPLKFTKNAQGNCTQVLAFGRDVWVRVKGN
ncbi:MAG TPA: S41 family peptidase [Cyclobacteriaceae bacterium]|jgi:hypothetical protein|nr:S41 family peptidase [Cyclobacteriaceae bacterium]